MSWYGNTLHPVVQDVLSGRAPKTTAEAAKMIEEAGHPDVASYIRSLDQEDYQALVESAENRQEEPC